MSKIFSNSFKNKRPGIRKIFSNSSKNKTRDVSKIFSNYFRNKAPWMGQDFSNFLKKNDARGFKNSFKFFPKQYTKDPQKLVQK